MGKRRHDQSRTARIAVMFTPEEYDALKRLAQQNGKTVATEVYDRTCYTLSVEGIEFYAPARFEAGLKACRISFPTEVDRTGRSNW